ncbi:hypothetical protein BV22DRAFT_1129715 [Leucogyrophana mollusca]|uniref:Uncharacterized protein n=1 Tax=Leucogyrophana mollusca TaxID=85980 RepID=A0ACB8BH78_9AGAM|nr:hypothetical protein BV22DRAFT_1129715 [Leucogyrophana mollusca]
MGDSSQKTSSIIESLRNEVLELASLESDLLARLQSVQKSLACKRTRLGEEMNQLTPAYRLPNETLIACFEEAIQHHPHTAKAMSQVSRRWRCLSINTPSLWTHVQVTPKTTSDIDLFQEFLRRSANFPIAVEFRDCIDPTKLGYPASLDWHHRNGDIYDYSSIVDVLLPSFHRITALASLDSITVLLSLLSGFNAPSTSPSSQGFKGLTALSLTASREISGSIPYSLFLQLLVASPNLKSLTVDLTLAGVPFSSDDHVSADAELSFPSLEYMSILSPRDDFGVEPFNFISSISAPALRHLALGPLYLTSSSHMQDTFFLNNTPRFPNVCTLTLGDLIGRGDYNSRFTSRTFVRAFPRIASLTIDPHSTSALGPRNLCYSGNDLLVRPPGRPRPELAWPDLQHLTITNRVAHARMSLSSVCSWLEARRSEGTGKPLRIRVSSPDPQGVTPVPMDFYRDLQKLKDYGDLDDNDIRAFKGVPDASSPNW